MAADYGKVALRRGPIVYCLEEADNGGELFQLALPVITFPLVLSSGPPSRSATSGVPESDAVAVVLAVVALDGNMSLSPAHLWRV